MPNHFSTIGFPISSEEEFTTLLKNVVPHSTQINVERGHYLFWNSNAGVELWLQFDRNNNFIGVNPHYSGKSIVKVALVEKINREDDTELDAAFYGWANPSDKNFEKGDYPFVFDLPDFQTYSDLNMPEVLEIQVAAFAHELSIYESSEAFENSQDTEPKFASKSFIPSGLFTTNGQNNTSQAYAIFSGHILEVEKKTNKQSGASFYSILVDTLGGLYDVVVDPTLIAQPPTVGNIVSGTFWLSGRLLFK